MNAMKESMSADSRGEVPSRGWRSGTASKALLAAGIVAVGVYGLGDLLSGLLSDGYSFKDQAISELAGFGSPVRPLMAAVIVVHDLLLAAFGVGVWRLADRRSLRWAGSLLVAAGLGGLPIHTVFAMSSRWMEGGFNDTMHIILTGVFGLIVSAVLVLAAVAYRGWFRLYSIATLLVVIGFGQASWIAIQGIEEDHTPWAGGFERINAYAYLAWLVVLAVTVLRRSLNQVTPEKGVTEAKTRVPSMAASG
jgi:hypothetical membrane protein